jgi:hypothetical protein
MMSRASESSSPSFSLGEESATDAAGGGSSTDAVFFDSSIVQNLFTKFIPFLPDMIQRSGRNVYVLVQMFHDLYCNLNVIAVPSSRVIILGGDGGGGGGGDARIMTDASMDALLGHRSKYALRIRKISTLMQNPRMIQDGQVIRLPLKALFPEDKGTMNVRDVHVLSSIRLGDRNDGVYRVRFDEFEGREFAMKVQVGSAARDMQVIYNALYGAGSSSAPPNEGYVKTYDYVTWRLPFVDGIKFTFSEWIEGKYLGVMLQEKAAVPCSSCSFCQRRAPSSSPSANKLCQSHRDIYAYVQILRTLYWMHARGVAHIDVHSHNIVVHPERGPIIIDLEDCEKIPDADPDVTWRKYYARDIYYASKIFQASIPREDFDAAFPLWANIDSQTLPPHQREYQKEDERVLERIVREVKWTRWGQGPQAQPSPPPPLEDMSGLTAFSSLSLALLDGDGGDVILRDEDDTFDDFDLIMA